VTSTCPSCEWCGTAFTPSRPNRRFCCSRCTKRAHDHKGRCATWPDCKHQRPRFGKAKKPILERLLNHIDQSGGPDACWPWTGYCNDFGHGLFRAHAHGRGGSAHRFMYAEVHGGIPDGLLIRHLCNNPPCCNPDHLQAGTQVENMADRQEHGAGYGRGNDFPTAVQISEETVAAIRKAYNPRIRGRGQHALAQQFGLSRTTVQRIVTKSDRWAESA
jgi:hypothetical protein